MLVSPKTKRILAIESGKSSDLIRIVRYFEIYFVKLSPPLVEAFLLFFSFPVFYFVYIRPSRSTFPDEKSNCIRSSCIFNIIRNIALERYGVRRKRHHVCDRDILYPFHNVNVSFLSEKSIVKGS